MPSDCIRLFDEHRTLEAYRTEYRRDYARVIHSSSFRRLQNKTQLFPGYESDFFRNRLTHSLEVAQIAKTIAIMLSEEEEYRHLPIEPDVCEIAGLIHDLGHPPFGHNGEDALNSCMGTYGGFEGNAQTIRIITKLEKKTANDEYHNEFNDDKRYGLNLTTRAIASALKYDTMIAKDYNGDVKKGYYESEKEIVNQVKKTLIGENYTGPFKTIECQIMDLADDIAYSTYDIEDAFKAGFLTPVNMMAADDMIFEQIVEKLFTKSQINSNVDECRNVLLDIFKSIWDDKIGELKAINKRKRDYGKQAVNKFLDIYRLSNEFALNGYLRTDFTSYLVKKFVSGIKVREDKIHPILSEVYLDDTTKLQVNVLKHFAFVCLINSSRLKVAEHRGKKIISSIFEALKEEGTSLISEDFQRLIKKGHIPRMRVICDYIVGMTDRYALEFYSRLFSENPQSIFVPF